MDKLKLTVEGMSCQHCVGAVSKALEAVPGVEVVTVSLEDKSALVTGKFSKDDLVLAVEKVGFGVS